MNKNEIKKFEETMRGVRTFQWIIRHENKIWKKNLILEFEFNSI